MFWPIIILVYLLFPFIGYLQYRTQKSKGQEADYTLKVKDLRTTIKVPASIELMRTGLWALGITVLSIFPLMGLPGGLVIELLHYTGVLASHKLAGEDLWPAALVLSFILPFGWPLAILIRNHCSHSLRISSTALFYLIFLLWFISIILFLILII